MTAQRLVSFLPAATEMIYLLGLENRLVGRSHECDHPEAVKAKPVICDCAINMAGMSMSEIDSTVAARLASGQSLYSVDETLLRRAAPDLLITQNLCQVCGPAGNEVSQVIKAMRDPPKIIWQSPRNIDDVFDAIRTLGLETGTQARAERWIDAARARIERVASLTRRLTKVRVAFLEWVDPLYCGGHWVPQMLEWAGAEDRNSKYGVDSIRISWNDVVDYEPEVILIAPCGFNAANALTQAAHLQSRPGWTAVPAVQANRVYAVDANAYFARPGPRLIDGIELIAHLTHPEHFDWTGARDAFLIV